MSVSTTGSVVSYQGNGVTTSFAFPYLFLSADHLSVVFTTLGVDTAVDAIQYTITGVGLPTGGTVTFTTPPPVGVLVTIRRNTDDTQQVDYVPQDNFPAETHETALDKLTLQSQDRQRTIDRTVRVSDSSASLPAMSLADRANKLLGFNDSGGFALDIATDAVRTLVLANPVNQLTGMTDYGTLTDVVQYALDYGTIL